MQSEEELKAAFALFDRDGNGFISLEELTYAMSTIGEKMSSDEIAEVHYWAFHSF